MSFGKTSGASERDGRSIDLVPTTQRDDPTREDQVAEELLDQQQDSSSLKSSKKGGAEKQGKTSIGSRQLK